MGSHRVGRDWKWLSTAIGPSSQATTPCQLSSTLLNLEFLYSNWRSLGSLILEASFLTCKIEIRKNPTQGWLKNWPSRYIYQGFCQCPLSGQAQYRPEGPFRNRFAKGPGSL